MFPSPRTAKSCRTTVGFQAPAYRGQSGRDTVLGVPALFSSWGRRGRRPYHRGTEAHGKKAFSLPLNKERGAYSVRSKKLRNPPHPDPLSEGDGRANLFREQTHGSGFPHLLPTILPLPLGEEEDFGVEVVENLPAPPEYIPHHCF